MFFFNIFGKIIKILKSNQSPPQISIGFIIGMFLGVTPFWALINLILLVILLVVNVNAGAAMLAYLIFGAVVFICDPILHDFGLYLLQNIEFMQAIWTWMYNSPLIPFTFYNNTVYLGSLVLAVVLVLPLYFGVNRFIINYRERYEDRVNNWKWVKWVKATKIYQIYEKLSFLGD